MDKLKAKLASFISASIFLGLMYVLFKKVHLVLFVNIPWWGFVLVLVALFFFIDTMVSRTLGSKEPIQRKKEQVGELGEATRESAKERLDKIRSRLNDR